MKVIRRNEGVSNYKNEFLKKAREKVEKPFVGLAAGIILTSSACGASFRVAPQPEQPVQEIVEEETEQSPEPETLERTIIQSSIPEEMRETVNVMGYQFYILETLDDFNTLAQDAEWYSYGEMIADGFYVTVLEKTPENFIVTITLDNIVKNRGVMVLTVITEEGNEEVWASSSICHMEIASEYMSGQEVAGIQWMMDRVIDNEEKEIIMIHAVATNAADEVIGQHQNCQLATTLFFYPESREAFVENTCLAEEAAAEQNNSPD